MKLRLLVCAAISAACCHFASAQEQTPSAPPGDAPAPAAASVTVKTDDGEKTYDLATHDGAKAYVEAYADNVRADKEFKAHEHQALATVRTAEPLYGSWWAIFPPLLAIVLALITKEVYSSLFLGIVSGGVLYAVKADGFRGMFETAITHIMQTGFIGNIASAYNIGILIFLVLLGALVAMMNKTGASAAFGRWAQTHIKSRVGAQVATIILGILIFVDDYFNCLTVGSVMRPVTQAKKVSAAKLAYLIDATAAPVCIIAPISSWAAAVAGFAAGAGAESGFSLFISAIPFNFYAILTIVTMFALAIMKFDFGPMRQFEQDVAAGKPDLGALEQATDALARNDRGRVIDLVIPVLVLIFTCVVGMIYSGGFFTAGGESYHDFMVAFSNSDASVGLVLGSIVALVFAVVFYVCRRVISFRDCMDGFPEGFKAMVPAIMILCCAWTLKGMTDALGAKVFISDLINGPAAALWNFLPAIIFVVALILAFSTGTSWGTFGILIPIVLAAIPGSSMTIIAVSACMAGAVCGDHCSPISDTTIMASAGAQCNHIVHVNTQLPYALLVAGVSFVAYIIAPFVKTAWIALPVAIALMLVTLFFLKLILKGPADGAADAISHKVRQINEK
jgi:tetracycline resistance efflux pump